MEAEMMQPNDIEEIDPASGDMAYFSVSNNKLRNLYLLTFGLYAIYWFYKNWQLQQPYMKKKIMPKMRGIFNIFFTHSLAKRIKASLTRQNQRENGSLLWFASLFVLFLILGNLASTLADRGLVPPYFKLIWIMLFYISSFPLVELQDKINLLKNDPFGQLNSHYSWINISIMVVGGILWLFGIVGSLAIISPPE
ncbi:hypothetical protein LCGC14_1220780 [marine sediment metagenome]|uniref:DUF4234 domain-containing protein n=1 Tax=marine sediment metagenome TaxID=412755 RepID=A0A0F9LBB0_9ZZZZ